MAIIDHSKFIPVFLGNIVRKRLEQTFLAIPNLYQSFWEKLLEKIWNNHFWPFQIYTSLFGKHCQKKKLEHPFLAIPNLYRSFWEKLSEKDWNKHFSPFLIYTSLLGKILLGQPFLFQKSLFEKNWNRMAIFGHSKFIPVFLGNFVRETIVKNCWKLIWNKKIGTNIFGHS